MNLLQLKYIPLITRHLTYIHNLDTTNYIINNFSKNSIVFLLGIQEYDICKELRNNNHDILYVFDD